MLLTLGLSICLACATPFPFAELEVGMSPTAVRDEFGEPEAVEVGSGDAGSCWCYLHEEQNWIFTLFPMTPATIPMMVASGDPWDGAYVTKSEVVLHFEANRLVRWETRESSGYWKYADLPPSQARYEHVLADPGDPHGGGFVIRENPLEYVVAVKTNCRWQPPPETARRIRAGDTCHVARRTTLWLDPKGSGDRKETLEQDQVATVLGRRCQWCHVEDELGREGWVACVYLDRNGAQGELTSQP
jgi:hypothetical protein